MLCILDLDCLFLQPRNLKLQDFENSSILKILRLIMSIIYLHFGSSWQILIPLKGKFAFSSCPGWRMPYEDPEHCNLVLKIGYYTADLLQKLTDVSNIIGMATFGLCVLTLRKWFY